METCPQKDHPRQARTEDEMPITAPSHPTTRVHPPSRPRRIRYSTRTELGSGSFGKVFKVFNVDSGEVLALKQIEWPGFQSHGYQYLKREVELFSKTRHDHIVEFIAAQSGNEGKHLDIFMKLKDGNLQKLVSDGLFMKDRHAIVPLARQMLQALDYLAYNGVVHRDVKPENILYTYRPVRGYHYQLADFGLSNYIETAKTWNGALIYMAPELDLNPGSMQTSKMDVWSLFVTFSCALNMDGFQSKPLHTLSLRIKAVQDAANQPEFRPIKGMAIVDPTRRASAADVLDKKIKLKPVSQNM